MGTRGKGEGSVYKDGQGRWTAAAPLPPDPVTGRRRRRVVRASSKPEVIRRMREVQLEVARTGDAPTSRGLTVAQWMERWIRQDVEPVRKPATTSEYRSSLRLHIAPAIGRRRLDRLTADDVRAVHRQVLASGASSATAAKVHRVLRAGLAAAAAPTAQTATPPCPPPSPPSRSMEACGSCPPRPSARTAASRSPPRSRGRRDGARRQKGLHSSAPRGIMGSTICRKGTGRHDWTSGWYRLSGSDAGGSR
ncbi:phage integrase central domain-containing protein [Actinomyces respiraculi]|uniref:phage integrase central domain-containing protein n=1 Tax=Actinomyces respiraculi TaxID=2744574 RepID=UPI00141F2D72|nr:hypothetical protein [Actinomyces respiraculi]